MDTHFVKHQCPDCSATTTSEVEFLTGDQRTPDGLEMIDYLRCETCGIVHAFRVVLHSDGHITTQHDAILTQRWRDHHAGDQ